MDYFIKTGTIVLALTLWSNIGFAQSTWENLGKNEKAGHYISLQGFKMYYEIYGEGSPLLFIHGNSGSINSFAHQVPFFSKKFKVILADSRAQGKSIDASDTLSYEMMADDFNELLDYLKIDSCYVLGWSDGGINGLLLALRHPKKVKKLAITGANLTPDTTALDPWIYHMIMTEANRPLQQPVTPKLKNDKKLMRLMAYQPHIATSSLKKISCPTLVIGGDHDLIPPRHTLLIAESLPNSYLWILPNSGHSTLVSYKNEFNGTVMDFFTKPFRKIQGAKRIE